jgi:amphi-Trp domain-containing protein
MSQSVHSHDFVSDPDQVAAFLEALIDGFKKRRLSVSFEGKEVILKPGEVLDLSLETARRKGRQRLTLSINWPDQGSKGQTSLLSPAELSEERRGS